MATAGSIDEAGPHHDHNHNLNNNNKGWKTLRSTQALDTGGQRAGEPRRRNYKKNVPLQHHGWT